MSIRLAIKLCLVYFTLFSKVLSENFQSIRNYKKVGCFRQSESKLRDLLINGRVEKEHLINWERYEDYLQSLAWNCSEKAIEMNKNHKKDYDFFSIRFYGECYAGKEASNTASVNGCKNGKFQGCIDTDIKECTGTALVEYLYQIEISVNGGYSEWSSFSSCSKSCDGGVKVRTRTCTNPKPVGEGKNCDDLGKDIDERICNKVSCSSGCVFKYIGGDNAGEVYIGEVIDENDCIDKCFEKQKSDSAINGIKMDLNGTVCYCKQGMKVSDVTEETNQALWKSCFIPLKHRNGGYSTWSSFSSCSKSCDVGVEVRTRTCTNPTPLGAGKDCREYGLDKEERKCNIELCIGCVFKNNDGVGAGEVSLGAVRNENECIEKCFQRQKIDPTINGVTTDLAGKTCYCEQGMTSQTGGSSWKSCYIPLKYRNGGYSEWSSFSTCSKSCDGGVEVRTRTCTNPLPIGEGNDCRALGPDREERKCNQVFCSSGCVFKNNDGVGAGEVHMGAVSNENECIEKCYQRQKTDPTINGVTTDLAGKTCYCEQGMTSQTGGSSWKSCYIPLKYRNGGYSDWSSFSTCSKSCDGGVAVRTRTCTNPTPVGEGNDCRALGPEKEEKSCNEVSCSSGCVFKNNDGVGAGEVHMGAVSNENECIEKCFQRQKIDPTINGVTTDLAGKTCYCEQGMTSQTGGSSWKSCYIKKRY